MFHLFLSLVFLLCPFLCLSLSQHDIITCREATREMFHHAYDNYLMHAFPADEIKPISCSGRHREGRGTLDDVLGEYSLTLIDSLSSLVVFGEISEFDEAVRLVIERVSFNSNVTVSVFESTIRVLGGLLSAHLLTESQSLLPWYDGELLGLATDLADRLLPAFKTRTGIPYQRVNLRYGVERNEVSFTCTACAGTLILEFGLLSRLVGDEKYENAAHKALQALWTRRSKLGLFGNTIDTHTGLWREIDSGIGAGIDSFYEYLLKSYIYFNTYDHYVMFNETYKQILVYLNHDHWYLPVDMNSGNTKYTWTDSLSAFWPGLQVIVGDIESAKQAHARFTYLWKKYGAVPERFDVLRGTSIHGINNYPLRPEFAESTYFLYQATRDPIYLEIGKNILEALQNCRVKCGYASIASVETGRLEDRMDSFFLSETCKYLFLLFDHDNVINKGNFIFTTEGHPLPMNLPWHKNSTDRVRDTCTYHRPKLTAKSLSKQIFDTSKSFKEVQAQCLPEEAPIETVLFHLSGLEKDQITHYQLTILPGYLCEVVINHDIYGQMAFFGPKIKEQIKAEAIAADPQEACSPLLNFRDIPGKIVVVKRGICLFIEKVLQAQAAGAIAVIVYNFEPGGVFSMGGSDSYTSTYEEYLTIPSLMVSKSDGLILRTLLLSQPTSYIYLTPLHREPNFHPNESLQLTAFTHQGGQSRLKNVPHGHSQVFVNADTIVFSLDTLGIDYTNKKMEFTFSDGGELDFFRKTPIHKSDITFPNKSPTLKYLPDSGDSPNTVDPKIGTSVGVSNVDSTCSTAIPVINKVPALEVRPLIQEGEEKNQVDEGGR